MVKKTNAPAVDKTTNGTMDAAALEHERLVSLINSMADGVIAVDQQAKVVLYNGAALNILDKNTVRTGQKVSSLLKLIDKNNQEVDVVPLVLGTKIPTSTRELRLQYPNDETLNLYLSIAPVHLGYGKEGQRGFVLLLRDITREKSLEEERDEFISVVSHELRTPIAIAEGNISNVQFLAEREKGIPQTILDSLKTAYDQVTFLAGMINDLATLSRAERGKLQVDVESVNVSELLQDLNKLYAPDAEKKDLKLLIEIDPALEALRSSKLYVKEILQNFVTNAIKYTEKGHVTIGAKPKKDGVMFYVADSGIGISKADQEKVFDKFFRSEDFRTRQSNGTGLGLYVTMKLARLIHAEIELASEINKGSTFSIFIPNLE